MKSVLLLFSLLLLIAGCNSEPAFDATGTFEATEVTVSSEATGRLMAFSVEEGDTVHAGTLLGVVDTMQLFLRKQQLMQGASAVRTDRPDVRLQIASIQEEITRQEHELARLERLAHAGAATGKQLDDQRAALRVLRKQLDAQTSSLHKRVGSLDAQGLSYDIQCAQLDDQLRKSRVSSPINGVVLAKYMEAGEYATPGRALFKVADMDNLYLRAYFTSSQLASVRLGQAVQVTADFGGDTVRDYPGRIVWIASTSEFTPKSIQTADSRASLVYAVKIAVQNDGYLKLGFYGRVKLLPA
jgi:HlyD family secretion protein